MSYYTIISDQAMRLAEPPAGAKLLKHNLKLLLPPLVTEMHRSFQAWGEAGLSPGPVNARRTYFNEQGVVAFHFMEGTEPKALGQAGLAPNLAAWLVLLDKWMETFVVVARARTIWSVEELSYALTFLTPAFLPDKLVAHPPDNWERVAQALAVAVADAPLQGQPNNRHWQTNYPS